MTPQDTWWRASSAKFHVCSRQSPDFPLDSANFTLETGPLHLEAVAGPVGVDQGPFAFFAAFALAMLHAERALVALAVDMAEDVPVIDLAGTGLPSAGVVAEV